MYMNPYLGWGMICKLLHKCKTTVNATIVDKTGGDKEHQESFRISGALWPTLMLKKMTKELCCNVGMHAAQYG